ncbi:MAG TPA: hypothetical protein DIU29_03275 [Candidatus Jacksonbacteria bacterium]|nr:hypothetical protein [Candidatus Jacksonbacteria bacterium]
MLPKKFSPFLFASLKITKSYYFVIPSLSRSASPAGRDPLSAPKAIPRLRFATLGMTIHGWSSEGEQN